MTRFAICLGVIALTAAWGAAPTQGQPEGFPSTLVVKVDSEESIRAVYGELGYEFDPAASEARREELQETCFMRGSRRYGNIPRPIKFIGLAYSRDDPARTLVTLCHALQPYDDRMARGLCEAIDRPLIENRVMELSLTCGARGTVPKPPRDSAGRLLGDWP